MKLFMLINNFFFNKAHLNSILSLISETANIRKTPLIIILLVAISFILIYRRKVPFDQSLLDPFSYRLFSCISKLSVSLVLIFIVIFPLKNYFHFLRPICVINHEKINLIQELSFDSIAEMVEEKCDPTDNSSFPSGHAAISVILIGAMWRLFNSIIRIISLFYPVAIGVSRIAIGVHYPVDLVAGYLIGFICLITAGFCCVYFERLLFRHLKFNQPFF